MSFYKSGDFGRNDIFIGFENYIRLLGDEQVWQATINTLKYTFFVVPLNVIIALILATILNKKIKGRDIYRTIYFIPMVATPAAITMVWKWLFNTDYGLINYLLSLVGIEGPSWLTNPTMAMISISIVTIWSSVGYDIILILAGLQGIPKTYYEAAKVDGASSIVQFFKITIPLVSPTLFFVLVLRVMAALKQFDFMYMLIGEGNPALEGTQTLTCLLYTSDAADEFRTV